MSIKKLALALVISLLVLSIGMPIGDCSSGNFPITLTDDMGNEVTVEKEPQRIISISPSNTEILFAIGAGDKVVGVTDYCDYPEEAKEKEKIGGFSDPSIEMIVALNPDLILITSGVQESITNELEKLDLTVLVIEPKTLEAMLKSVMLMGKAIGQVEEAEELVSNLQERIDKVVSKTEVIPEADKPKVFFEVWNDPLMTAGPGSFLDDMIRLAGGINIAADTDKEYPMFSLEALVARDPEVIIGGHITIPDLRAVEKREGWTDIKAVKEGRIYAGDINIFVRPGPRLVDGLEAMAKFIHPELFE